MTLSFQFGTVGSPIGTPKKPGGSVGAIEFSQSIGLTTFELGWVQSVRVTEAACAAIKEKAMEKKVSLSVHAPYFINLNADEEEWPKSRKRLMDAAFYGNLAGASDIIFHPGSCFSFEEKWSPGFTQAGQPTAHWSFLYALYLAGAYAVLGVNPLAARIVGGRRCLRWRKSTSRRDGSFPSSSCGAWNSTRSTLTA